MQFKPKHKSRRGFLTTFVAVTCGLIPAASAFPGTADTSENSRTTMELTHLIDALRSIGTPVCLHAAERLVTATTTRTEFDLTLRGAELNAADARILTEGIRLADIDSRLPLRSFSVSFNPDLGDNGATALVNAFPESMKELGMVGCSVGDTGGRAILEWAKSAPNLSMLCVEGNRFSTDIQSHFKNLATHKRQMIVVV